uniref:Endonuclease domain-containing 1 protein-like n=1 Tax=Knipowitschia caucasica TaxID=637954 RepID=A0AAV2LF78_KNICA
MAYPWLLFVLFFATKLGTCGGDVGDFGPCLQFFYSRSRRAPWFSAYVYSIPSGKRPGASWKYEPQLAYPEANGNMELLPQGLVDLNVVESQAVDQDYTNSTFSRGHLNPSLHHQVHEDRSSTFTLTNAVPQKAGSNDGPWETLEQTVNKTLAAYCIGKAYIVTGIIPYQNQEHWIKNKRVAVPEYLWSAYCCPQFNNSLPQYLRSAFPTYAAIGRNDINSTEEIVPINKAAKKQFFGYDVRQMSLETLEMYLKQRFNSVVNVFYDSCSEQPDVAT